MSIEVKFESCLEGDPRYEFCKQAPVLLQQSLAILQDKACMEWFEANGVKKESFYKVLFGLTEIGEAYKNYAEFLERIIKNHEDKIR